MNTYKVKYRKRFVWKNLTVIGHRLDKDLNRMDLYLPDGSILSFAEWSKYDMKLGVDWVLFTKKEMEKQASQKVILNV